MKKVLILSFTAGGGHNATAKAMRAYFWAHDAECDILDTIGSASPTFAKSLDRNYLWISSKAKNVWRVGYRLAEKRKNTAFDETIEQIVSSPFKREIATYIQESEPDVILFTHPFGGVILDDLKRSGKLSAPTVGILTDFVFHPFWEDCTGNDYVVIPAAPLRYQARRKGFADSQVLPLGIPILPKFAGSVPQKEAREALGLDPECATVLLMSGSVGYVSMEQTVRDMDSLDLAEDFQILAVCGNNKKVLKDLQALETRHRMLPFGFVDNVDVMMDASDCIITKPGGMTISEALAKRLPIVIVNPIPGQETRNTEFLLNSGAAVAANKICGVDELVAGLLEDRKRLDAMRASIELLRHPDSTRDVCEFALSLAKE